jgi:hypothetical protein
MAISYTSWIWFCEDCGVVGTFQLHLDDTPEVNRKLHSVHRASSAASLKCPGHGLKLISPDDLRGEKIFGRMRRHPRPLIVSYFTNEEYGAYATILGGSARLLRLDYEIDQIDPKELEIEKVAIEKVPGFEDPGKLRAWKAAVLYKPEFIRRKLRLHPGRDIIWVDADAKILTYPEFLMAENPDFDISYFHMDVLRDITFGGTVFYRNCPAVVSLVDEWAAEVKRNPKALDERSLATVVKARKDIVFKSLPPELCWVERWMRANYRSATPVIEQYAVSRPLVNPIRMPV